jgi:hypothetical protein
MVEFEILLHLGCSKYSNRRGMMGVRTVEEIPSCKAKQTITSSGWLLPLLLLPFNLRPFPSSMTLQNHYPKRIPIPLTNLHAHTLIPQRVLPVLI